MLGVTPFSSHICYNYFLHVIITLSYYYYIISFLSPWRLTIFIPWLRRVSEIHPSENLNFSIYRSKTHFTQFSRNNSHAVSHLSCFYFFDISLMYLIILSSISANFLSLVLSPYVFSSFPFSNFFCILPNYCFWILLPENKWLDQIGLKSSTAVILIYIFLYDSHATYQSPKFTTREAQLTFFLPRVVGPSVKKYFLIWL